MAKGSLQSSPGSESAYRAFKRYAEQLLSFDGEFHRKLSEHFLTEAAHDHVHCIFRRNATLIAVEDLIFPNLRCRRLMLYGSSWVLDFNVWESMRSATIAHQHGVTLRIVSGVLSARVDFHQSAVGVLTIARRDTLGDDCRSGVFADMDHLGPGISLLLIRR